MSRGSPRPAGRQNRRWFPRPAAGGQLERERPTRTPSPGCSLSVSRRRPPPPSAAWNRHRGARPSTVATNGGGPASVAASAHTRFLTPRPTAVAPAAPESRRIATAAGLNRISSLSRPWPVCAPHSLESSTGTRFSGCSGSRTDPRRHRPHRLGLGWHGRGAAPALVYGYSDKVLAQLPTVRRDGDNATAAAFRIRPDLRDAGHDATAAAPWSCRLLTPDGCAGVLALELHQGVEETRAVRAAATILAAVLTQLVRGPIVGRPGADRRSE